MADNTLIERGTYRARTSTEGTRKLYTWARATLAPGTARRRRRAAQAERDKANFEIPAARGWTVLEPGHFEEAAAIVAEAQEALAAGDVDTVTGATSKARKGFMRSLLEPSSVTVTIP